MMIELYKFTHGATVFRYTSADRDVTHDDETWEPKVMERSGIDRGRDEESHSLSIETTHDNPVALLHLRTPPDHAVMIDVYQRAGDDYDRIFTGTLSDVTWDGAEARLHCASPVAEADKPGLKGRFQRTCRWALYSRGCSVDPEDHRMDGLVDELNPANPRAVRSDAALALGAGWLTGGYVIINGQARLVTANGSLGWLDLAARIEGIAVNQEIIGYRGCNHKTTNCANIFDNLANFGGFTSVPKANPFTRDIRFSGPWRSE
jgi:uncharacterized phage protein (TIGR02218 family)